MSVKLPIVKVNGKTYSLLIVKTGSKPKQRYFLLGEKLGEGNDRVVYEAYEAERQRINATDKFRYHLKEKPAKPLAIKIEKNYSSKDRLKIMAQREVEARIYSNLNTDVNSKRKPHTIRKPHNTDIYPIGDHDIAMIRPKLPGIPLSDLINTEEFKKLTLSQRLELAKIYAEFHGKQGRVYYKDKNDSKRRINLNQSNFLVNIKYAENDKKHEHPIFECNIIDFVDLSVRTPLTTAPECIHGEEIGCPLDNALEMETYSLTAMIALILGETDVFKNKKNNGAVKGKFNLENMKRYLEIKSKELNLETEINVVIDMVQSMQDDNPALRPSALAIVKVLNRAHLVALRKERKEPDDMDIDATILEEFFAAIKAGDLKDINDKYNPELLEKLNIDSLTPFGVAIKYGQYHVAEYLLTWYKNDSEVIKAVRQTDGNGRTLLHLAILANRADLVELLLNSGADANEKDADKRTPLHCAISMRCDFEIIQNLLRNGASVEAENSQSRDPVRMAIANACAPKVVDLLIEKKPKDKENIKRELLFLAIKSGSKELVEDFWNDKIEPRQYQSRVSPLHFAALLGHEEVAKFLIKKGFQPNYQQDREGNTPLHYAAMAGQLDMAMLLLGNGTNKGGQTNAVNKKFHEVTDSNGDTLLHIAVREGKINFVGRLIEIGANVNVKDRQGKTPLQELHKLTDSNGDTLLHIAIQKGKVDLAKRLIEKGMNVNVKNSEGMTPLHFACLKGNAKAISLLLKHDANVSVQDERRNTPLHYAILNGDIELAGSLLRKGAKVNVENDSGVTPLRLGIALRKNEMRELLSATQSSFTNSIQRFFSRTSTKKEESSERKLSFAVSKN